MKRTGDKAPRELKAEGRTLRVNKRNMDTREEEERVKETQEKRLMLETRRQALQETQAVRWEDVET